MKSTLDPSHTMSAADKSEPDCLTLANKGDGSQRRRSFRIRAAQCKKLGMGILLGWLATLAISTLNLDSLLTDVPYWDQALIILGGIAGLTRARALLWLGNGLLFVLFLVIGYTPVSKAMWRDLQENDPLQPADAVFVLASVHLNDSTISAHSQDRLLHALDILHAGYADRLVLTRPEGEAGVWPALARREITDLGLNYPIDELGPVHDTHSECQRVAQLVRERGWRRVILVTHAWHMRRAATFLRNEGVDTICSPCTDCRGDLENLDAPGDRFRVFKYWLHEKAGYVKSRLKGWV
jgi:uncharacterized SAM-binding protein YcdF (DUF218 family)